MVAAAVVVALASTLNSGRDVVRRLRSEHSSFAQLTGAERRQAPLERLGVPGDVFGFYASYTVPGDRVYLQVLPGDGRPAAFAAATRYYLLPARETTRLADATVVISYEELPSALRVHFVTQRRFGNRPVYVSRIGVP
jgi:hypothetical protein